MRYEYYSGEIDESALNDRLNELGNEGWYLVKVELCHPATMGTWRVFMIRNAGHDAVDQEQLEQYAATLARKMKETIRGDQ